MIPQFTKHDMECIQFPQDLYQQFQEMEKECNGQIQDLLFAESDKAIFAYCNIYRNKNSDLSNDETTKTKECISLAMHFYNDFVKTLAVLKLFFAIKIIAYFSQSFDLLDTTSLTAKHKDKINRLLDDMNFNIQVPKNAPYNERKLHSLFIAAIEKKDFHIILDIMNNLSHNSNVFNKLNSTWGIFIQWIWFYDKKIVLNFLSRTQNFMNIEFIFQSLKNDISAILSYLDNQTNCYVLLRGIAILFEELEHMPFVNNNELEKIPDYSDFLVDLLREHQQEFQQYMQVLRISHLKSYNFNMGIVLAKNQKLLPFYIGFIDTTIQPSYAFSTGFLNNCADLETVVNVSEKIMQHFLENDVKHFDPIHKVSGYIDLFIRSIVITTASKEKYLEKLNDISNEIYFMENSWCHEKITMKWIYLFYHVLANEILKYSFTKAELRKNIPFLYDKRYELIYDKTAIDTMKNILSAPQEYRTITVKNFSNEEFKITFQ